MSKQMADSVLAVIPQLTDKNGMVPVYHKTGKCIRWNDNGRGGQELDPNSITHDFLVPATQFTKRTGHNAGGTIVHAVIPAITNSFTIVRLEQGRLVMGDRNLPNWMY